MTDWIDWKEKEIFAGILQGFGFDMTQDFGKGLWIPVHQPRSCWETANQDNSKNKKVPNWFIVPEAVE